MVIADILLGVFLGWLPILAMLAACYVMSVRDRSTTPPEAYLRSAQRHLTDGEDTFEPWILREARKIVAKRLK